MSKATLSDDIQEASKILKTIAHLDVKIEEHSDVNMSEQSESSWSSEHLSDSDSGQKYGMQVDYSKIRISRLQQNSALSKLQKQTKRSKPVVDAIVTKRKSATTGKFASLTSALEEIVQYFQASQTHLLTRRSLRE
jgi:hypothetical protein